jgi:hypothetical protein
VWGFETKIRESGLFFFPTSLLYAVAEALSIIAGICSTTTADYSPPAVQLQPHHQQLPDIINSFQIK